MALGVTNKFSWRDVALGALGGGVSAGVAGSGLIGGANASPSAWVTAGRAAASSVITQGVAVATGLQPSFSWRGVAGAAIGSAVGNQASTNLSDTFNEFTRRTLTGIASGTMAQLVAHGKVDFAQVAADAFGNALGSGLVDYMKWQAAAGPSEPPAAGRPVSQRQLERLRYGGLNADLALDGEKDWLGGFNPYEGLVGSNSAGNFSDDVAHRQAENVFIPRVLIVGKQPTVYDQLATAFNTNPELIRRIAGAADDGIELSRLENERFYTSGSAKSTNSVTRALWHVAGLANEVAHNLASAGRGVYRIATDENARDMAVAGARDTWDHLPTYAIRGMQSFSDMTLGQKTDALIKFGLESAATAGLGRAASVGGRLAYDGTVATLKWISPKAGEWALGFVERSGLIMYAVENSGNRVPGLVCAEGAYGDLVGTLDEGFQAHHLNQNAAFGAVIPRSEGLSIGIRGNAFTDVGTPHYQFHNSLERFWDSYREGGDWFGEVPTNGQYGNAVQTALKDAGLSKYDIERLSDLANQNRVAFGLLPDHPVPRVPFKLYQRGGN
jgi:hypothetical protein